MGVSGRERHEASPAPDAPRPACWFCKVATADGASEPVDLSIVVEKSIVGIPIVYRAVTIPIPRCRRCHGRRRWWVVGGCFPAVLGVVGLILSLFWVNSRTLTGVSLGLAIVGFVWAVFVEEFWLQRNTADFPEVRALRDAGGSFGIPADTYPVRK